MREYIEIIENLKDQLIDARIEFLMELVDGDFRENYVEDKVHGRIDRDMTFNEYIMGNYDSPDLYYIAEPLPDFDEIITEDRFVEYTDRITDSVNPEEIKAKIIMKLATNKDLLGDIVDQLDDKTIRELLR